MLKKSGLQAKVKRTQRRIADMSGDLLAAGGLLFFAVLLTVIFIYTYSYVVSFFYFQVKEVSVRGLKELTEKDILKLAGIKPQQNLLAVSTDAVVRKVSQNPWVKEVNVGRELPNKLVLEVKERIPLALLRQSGDFYLVDREGFVFKKMTGNDEVDLPIITGMNQNDKTLSPLFLSALHLLDAWSGSQRFAYLGTVSEIHMDDVFGISVITDKGLCLKLGTEKFEKKISRLKGVLEDLEKRGMRTAFLCVDLSDESKVTVQRSNIPEREQRGDRGKQYFI